MKYAPEALGLFVIAPLIAAGLWLIPAVDRTELLSPSTDGASTQRVSMSCVNQVDWSEDDQNLFIRYRGGSDSEARLALLDLAGKKTEIPFDAPGEFMNVATLSTDGRQVLIGTHRGHLWRLDAFAETDSRLIAESQGQNLLTSIAVSDDGGQIAAGAEDGQIYVVGNSQPDTLVLVRSGQQSSVSHLQFSPNGKWLLAALSNGRVCLWDVPSRALLQEFSGHDNLTKSARFLNDASQIISVGLDDTVRIWDVESGREIWRGDFGLHGLGALDVSPVAGLAAWGGNSGRIIVWDLQSSRSRFQVDSGLSAVFGLDFSRDGRRLAVVGAGAEVQIFDTHSGQKLTSLLVSSR